MGLSDIAIIGDAAQAGGMAAIDGGLPCKVEQAIITPLPQGIPLRPAGYIEVVGHVDIRGRLGWLRSAQIQGVVGGVDARDGSRGVDGAPLATQQLTHIGQHIDGIDAAAVDGGGECLLQAANLGLHGAQQPIDGGEGGEAGLFVVLGGLGGEAGRDAIDAIQHHREAGLIEVTTGAVVVGGDLQQRIYQGVELIADGHELVAAGLLRLCQQGVKLAGERVDLINRFEVAEA